MDYTGWEICEVNHHANVYSWSIMCIASYADSLIQMVFGNQNQHINILLYSKYDVEGTSETA
jgi:hypothetical protein